MAGERILVVDSSTTVQEITQSSLAEAGYKVRTGANGMAALTVPEIEQFDLIMLDVTLDGVDGYRATRELKTDAETYETLVLLLVPEEITRDRTDPDLRGANGYLLKPFEPKQLVAKVQGMLQERQLAKQSQELLNRAADNMMARMAEEHIQQAVESKTQIIVERAIQSVVSQIDQRATQEVNQRVTQLTAEKEQELVRMIVHEVAQSMVEKLAERKVTEAIETTLRDSTDKAVKRSADKNLPSQVRERIKETLELILPREVNAKVQAAVEKAVPDIYTEMAKMFDSVATKVVQRVARERLPEMMEKHIEQHLIGAVPRLVRETASAELSKQSRAFIEPELTKGIKRITVLSIIFYVIIILTLGGYFAADFLNLLPSGENSKQEIIQVDESSPNSNEL